MATTLIIQIGKKIYVPADKNQYPTHRYVASFFQDVEGLDVHHCDENPQNNTPENLEPMPSSQHRALHGKKTDLVTAYIPKYENMMKKMKFQNVIEAAIYAKNYNHKVVSVRRVKLPTPVPVYDITVEKYHNFLIRTNEKSGVFVHNSHIRTLVLTLFYRHFPELILNGNLYSAQSPLYRVKIGKSITWAYDDAQLKVILAENKTSKMVAGYFPV